MGTLAQYAISISLFVAIPASIQWAVAKLTARRTLAVLESDTPTPLAQPVRE